MSFSGGISFQRGDSADPETFSNVGGVFNVDGLGEAFELFNITGWDSDQKEYAKGDEEEREITIECRRELSDEIQNQMIQDVRTDTVVNFRFTITDGEATDTFIIPIMLKSHSLTPAKSDSNNITFVGAVSGEIEVSQQNSGQDPNSSTGDSYSSNAVGNVDQSFGTHPDFIFTNAIYVAESIEETLTNQTIANSGDRGMFATTLTQGVEYIIELVSSNESGNTELYLYDENGGASISYSGGTFTNGYSRIIYTPNQTGIYLIGAMGYWDVEVVPTYDIRVREFAAEGYPSVADAVNNPMSNYPFWTIENEAHTTPLLLRQNEFYAWRIGPYSADASVQQALLEGSNIDVMVYSDNTTQLAQALNQNPISSGTTIDILAPANHPASTPLYLVVKNNNPVQKVTVQNWQVLQEGG